GLARKRAVYSDEFKRFVVLRLRMKEQTATDLAIELGIRRNQLYKWAKKFDDLGPAENFRSPGRPPIAECDELTQLRCKLAVLEEELEILKKFDAYSTRRTR
ncbi:MAG TPA: transposase, partial [Telluria sp.]